MLRLEVCGSIFLLCRLFKLGEPSHSRLKTLKQWYLTWLRTIAGWSAHSHYPSQSLLRLVPAVHTLICTWWLSYRTLFLSASSHVPARPFLWTSYTELKHFFVLFLLKWIRSRCLSLFLSMLIFFRDVNLFINHGALTYPYHQHVMHKPILGRFSALTFIQKL